MILTRTPLRISLGGGGTDLPSYYREYGGLVLSAAIDKYVYVGVNTSFSPGYLLKYAESEHALTREEIRHRSIREALTVLDVDGPIEIVSMADVPAGTGLGSSGSFLVGLLHALRIRQGRPATAGQLAAQAAEIEIERLAEPVGKQDQYIAAYGGLLCQEYSADGTVQLSPLRISEAAIEELRDSLMLFFVGKTRSSFTLLEDQRRKSELGDRSMIESLHFAKELGFEVKRTLESGEIARFGRLMHEHWMRKRDRSPGISSGPIDAAYEHALRHGQATGGKLVGAGGGGFLLLQTRDRERLRHSMAETGMREVEFGFDFEGSVVKLRDEASRPKAELV
jgi:D-glycero-alpha-D-manno-heptose-7-phosphate kinase